MAEVKSKNPHENGSEIISKLPDALLKFLKTNGIDEQVYKKQLAVEMPRHIRINPRKPIDVAQLEKQLTNSKISACPVPGFYSINGQCSISSCAAYKQGQIYGVDLPSGLAVCALDVKPNDHVLDLCCAPGAKLCMLSDQIATGSGSVTGVDVNIERLNACRTMIRKYKAMRTRLFCADGQTFNESPPNTPIYHCRIVNLLTANATSNGEQTQKHKQKRKSKQKQTERKETKDGKALQTTTTSTTATQTGNKRKEIDSHSLCDAVSEKESESVSKKSKTDTDTKADKQTHAQTDMTTTTTSTDTHSVSVSASHTRPSLPAALYDKVLVDAECTHDGSIKHIVKSAHSDGDSFAKMLDEQRLLSIQSLQRGLIRNGYRLLKPGGVLVYSTCSFCPSQNEDMVKWLLNTEHDAELVPIHIEGVRLYVVSPSVDNQLVKLPSLSVHAHEHTGMDIDTTMHTDTKSSDAHTHAEKTDTDTERVLYVERGLMDMTLRFTPVTSHSSGLFVAKIVKRTA